MLNGVDAVPESGTDLVWYRLSELTVEEEIVIDPAKAVVFASIEDRISGLLEGVMYTTPGIREYAAIALENIGEAAAEAAVELAEENATEEGLAWFNQRSEWSGAPSWRIDLWGAAAALSPRFKINKAYIELLAKGGRPAEKIMSAEQFRPLREIIPFLLFQLAESKSSDEDKVEQAARCRMLAMKHLTDAGHQAVFPLVAALSGADREIAMYSAQVLKAIGGARVEQIVIDEYMKQLSPVEESNLNEPSISEREPEEDKKTDVEEQRIIVRKNPLEELSGTPFHNAMFEFDIPALEPFLMKIRRPMLRTPPIWFQMIGTWTQ